MARFATGSRRSVRSSGRLNGLTCTKQETRYQSMIKGGHDFIGETVTVSTGYTPSDFIERLRSGTLAGSPRISGMVRLAGEVADRIEFSANCSQWVYIPVEMIDRIDYVGTRPCKDHAHNVATLYLKEPGSEEAKVLARVIMELVSSSPRRSGTYDEPRHLRSDTGDWVYGGGCVDCIQRNCPDRSDFFLWLQCVYKYCGIECP